MKNIIRYFTFQFTISIILFFQSLNAQDITGDWYGVWQEPDSFHIVLHIYEDHKGFHAVMDRPLTAVFSDPIDEITFRKDTLYFYLSDLDLKFKGYVNQDYTKIYGEMTSSGHQWLLNLGRTKIKRIIPVDEGSLTVRPAIVRVEKAVKLRSIPYSGVRVVKAGSPEVIEVDTSELKVITPGENSVPIPRVFTFQDTIWESGYPIRIEDKPVIYAIKAKQPKPLSTQPMRMRDFACFNIQYLDLEQGLQDPVIWRIFEDSGGNIWFTSLSGVFRYDGTTLTYYQTKEGLGNVNNREIIEDREGNLWIGTSFGLCKYDGKSFMTYPGYVFGQINSMVESRNGNLWIGTTTGVFEKQKNSFVHYTENEGLINNSVWSLIEDHDGNLWFGTDSGACKYDGVSFTHFTVKEGLNYNCIPSITDDKYGNIWFATGFGVCKYDGKSFQQYTVNEGLSNNNVSSLMEDKNGCLWMGTWGGGVMLFDGRTFTHYTSVEGLNNENVISIMEDRTGNIWFGTYGGGVMKFQRNSFTYFSQTNNILKGTSSIFEDSYSNIWLSLTGSLIKYDGESFTTIAAAENPNLEVSCITEDNSGNIWCDHYLGGIIKYDGKSFTIYREKVPISSDILSIIGDKQGNIWFGTWGAGIIKFDGHSFTHYYQSVNSIYNGEFVQSILEDQNGNIWYGSLPWGLFRYDGKCVIHYNQNENLTGREVTSLFEDSAGDIWIGTINGGINKYDGKSFIHFTEKDGLCNNDVTSIIEDRKGNIWVGTIKGLSVLSPQGKENYSITSYGIEDGLKKLNFNTNSVCLDSRNRLWWGTADIVTMLDLNVEEIIPNPPQIQLNNIYLKQKFIDFRALLPGTGEEGQNPSDTNTMTKIRGLKFSDVAPFYNYPLDLELPHYLNHITFDFSATEWSAPQGIRYQYMVEGLDKQWSALSKDNQADYRNIPSGNYIFRVKAISKANLWSETLEYPFTVRHPWWSKWWAVIIYTIAFIFIARYYIKYILSRERIKAEVQIKQVEVDKMQELDEMKSRFFANISHEFRTPLTLLLGPINDLLQNRPGMKEEDRRLLKIMKRNTGRLQQLINQLLDLARLETGKLKLEVSEGDLTGHIRIIVLSFISLAESKHINYEYSLSETDQKIYFDSDKVEKIVTNLISNALKFTPERGSVNMTLNYIKSRNILSGLDAEIIIRDTGPGIPDGEREKIFDRFYQVSSSDSREYEGSGIGLALARELVELYRGKIHVGSEIGKGSTFTVRIPVSMEQFRENEIIPFSEKQAENKLVDEYKVPMKEKVTIGIHRETELEKDKDLPLILIVEDNTDLRRYISDNLLNKYQILEAENGKEGLDKAIESIPDLVISDLMMPGMDGIELCGNLKNDTRTSHIPLIILTARADRESKLEGLETGADDYIIKPFDANELQVRVKNLIEQRKKLREKYRKEFLMEPAGNETSLSEDKFLAQLVDCTKKHLEDPEFNVKKLGEELGLSHTQLYRKTISLTDYTPNEFIRNIRLKTAARMLLEGNTNISAVLYTVGYNSPSYFTESFRELFGLNPSDYIRQHGMGKNPEIRNN